MRTFSAHIALLLFGLLLGLSASAQIREYNNNDPAQVSMFWQAMLAANKTYQNNVGKGQSQAIRALRDDYHSKAMQLVQEQERLGRFYEDDLFMSDYLTNLIQLASGGVSANTRKMATARIEMSPVPNAYAYPDGTLVFTTRLLAMAENEEELLGVVAHEMAHFMLEHSVSNYVRIKKKENQARNMAIIGAVVSAAAGAATEVAAAQNDPNYIPGSGIAAGAALSDAINTSLQENLENLGYKYSQEQEYEADMMAVRLLQFLGVDKNYYISMLEKLRAEDYRFGREVVRTSKKSTHPALDARIAAVQNMPSQLEATVAPSKEYTKKIASALTVNAMVERVVYKDYPLALKNIARIEDATTLSFDDYLIKIPTMLDLYNNAESNQQVLALLKQVKSESDHPSIHTLSKYEAMVCIRLRDAEGARTALQEYIDYCNTLLEDKYKTDAERQAIRKEKTWAESAIRRV